jgi:hypothetical protein
MRNKIFYTVLGILSLHCASAQTDSSKAQFKIGAFYNSNLNYYGRVDSLKSSGFFPLAEIWFDDHFYINAAPVFVSNKTVSFDYAGTVATAGYQFKSDDSKWAGNFYGVKPFYKSSSNLVQSALKGQVAFTLSSLNQVINITGGADAKFSDKTDIGVTGGLDHVFRKQFSNNAVLVIDPSAYVFAGTQQFTNSYLKKTNFLLFNGPDQLVSEDVKKFNVLSYEFSMPVVFAKGKFQALITPAYVLPQNLVQVQGRPDLSERGKNLFYITAGAKMIL